MEKNVKLRVISGVVAATLSIGGSYMLSNNGNAYADTIIKKKYGTFIEDFDEHEESEYIKYVVQEGDNLSNISRRICRYFGEKVTTKYWPVIAYLNGYPKIINPDDEVIFPSNYEDMENLLNDLDESGWIANYRKMLRKRREIKERYQEENAKDTVGSIIDEIYGPGTSNDKDFVKRYLKEVGFPSRYNADTVLSKEEAIRLTESIPSLEELGINVKKKKK